MKMSKSLAALKQSNLHRLLKPPKISTTNRLHLRHLSTEPHHPPSPPEQPPSVVTQVLTQLQHTENDNWKSNDNILQLLFPSQTPLPPKSFLQITRHLQTTHKALKFLHLIRDHAPSKSNLFLSSTFQAIFELATREQPNSPANVSQLLALSKELNIPLTVDSAILLIKYFGFNNMIEKSVLVYNELDPDSRITHVTNLVVDVLLRYGQFDDALNVLDEMLKPDDAKYPPNKSTLDIFLAAVTRRNWSGRSVSEEEILGLLSKFRKHGVLPSNLWLTKLITRFCRSGESGKAWDLLHDMMKLGKVEAAPCNALLSKLGRDNDNKRVNLLLKEMKENGVQPDIVTFGILVNHLCKFRRVDEAMDVLKKMREGSDGISVKPDVILYNTLIDGLCKVGRQEEGLVLMEQMRSKYGCMPNTITYNCLIDGFCKSGEIDRSNELFNQMNKEGIEPNVITLNTLVDGMCKHGRLSNAMDFFRAMEEKGLKGNAVTYCNLISAFCNTNNIEKAIRLFDEMLDSGCSPDAIVYYTLISGLTQAGKLDDASFVASKMKEAGFSLDVVSYNILIGGFCRKGRLDKAVNILTEMEQARVKPDGITFNTLISYFSENGDFETAHRIMRQMIDGGHVPTVVTYGSLIHAYCLAGNLEEALKIFHEMGLATKVPPNTVIYNILIDALCKKGKVSPALSLMEDMKRKGVRPNTTTFNAMFKGLWDKNWLEKALKLMDQMTEQACNPDYITMEILTDWLSEVGEVEKLKSFVQGYEVSSSTA